MVPSSLVVRDSTPCKHPCAGCTSLLLFSAVDARAVFLKLVTMNRGHRCNETLGDSIDWRAEVSGSTETKQHGLAEPFVFIWTTKGKGEA